VLATGLEPGISSVLARLGADRLGRVDAIETALLLGAGDAYGPDSMGFILEELGSITMCSSTVAPARRVHSRNR
jgi:hypothetical protein